MSITQYVLRSAIVLTMLSPAIPASAALSGKLDTTASTTRLGQSNDLIAKKGADDKPGHVRHGRDTDDKSGHNRHGRGSDDPAGDDHGGRRS